MSTTWSTVEDAVKWLLAEPGPLHGALLIDESGPAANIWLYNEERDAWACVGGTKYWTINWGLFETAMSRGFDDFVEGMEPTYGIDSTPFPSRSN